MRSCIVCGKPLDDDARFCGYCGAKVTENYNVCTNPDCAAAKKSLVFDSDVRYCKYCGSLTSVGKSIEDLL